MKHPDLIVRSAWSGTVVLAVALGAGVLFVSPMAPVAAAVSLVLFFVGVGAYLVAFTVGLRRSQVEEVTVPGLFMAQGSAPKPIQRSLLSAAGVQTVLAITAGSIRPFTTVAFGLLAPTYGLGLIALWAARKGEFGPRVGGPR
jgi:hypothetical protein